LKLSVLYKSSSISDSSQKIANAFGGEPTAPGTFKGIEVRKKVYRPVFAQCSDKAFRSHSSPMHMPNRLRRYG
jgi:hypothetical protein